MQKTRHTSQIICLIILCVMLSGCGKIEQERDDAVAAAEAAKTQLAQVKTQLAETQTQLTAAEAFKTKLTETQAALAAAGDENTALQAQVAKLTTEIDKARKTQDQAALSLVTMMAKMQQQAKLNLENEKLIQDLQAKVKELTDKLKPAGSVVPNLSPKMGGSLLRSAAQQRDGSPTIPRPFRLRRKGSPHPLLQSPALSHGRINQCVCFGAVGKPHLWAVPLQLLAQTLHCDNPQSRDLRQRSAEIEVRPRLLAALDRIKPVIMMTPDTRNCLVRLFVLLHLLFRNNPNAACAMRTVHDRPLRAVYHRTGTDNLSALFQIGRV